MPQNPLTGREEYQEMVSTVGPVVPGHGKGGGVYVYDFTKAGGAVGDIFLLGPSIPKGAVITNSYMDVTTALTPSNGDTVAVTVESAGDIQAAAAKSGAPWSTTGLKDTTAPEPGTESGYIKTTAVRQPKITVATSAVTGGVFRLVLEWDVTNQ